MEDKNKPSSGSLFKSKFKTNDGSEEDNKRESYYGTYKDEMGKVWKLTGYINKGEYGTWLKVYTREVKVKVDGGQRPMGDLGRDAPAPVSKDEFEDDIPF